MHGRYSTIMGPRHAERAFLATQNDDQSAIVKVEKLEDLLTFSLGADFTATRLSWGGTIFTRPRHKILVVCIYAQGVIEYSAGRCPARGRGARPQIVVVSCACGSLWTRIFQVWMRSPRRPNGGRAASREVVEGRGRAAHFVGSRRECQKNR